MMFAWKHAQILTILLLCCGMMVPNAFAKKHHAHAAYSPLPTHTINGPQNLADELNRIIYANNPNLNIGVQVKSMTTGEMLYAKNEQKSFVPASILKIFTAESALLLLGPNYKFPTTFVTDTKPINGVVNGDVYLILTGDPSLTYYDLEDMVQSLKSQHIQQINGNLYIDSTAYDQEIYGPGWVWNDKRFCYAAPISASIVNHNCLSFQVKPNKAVGHSANIVDNLGYTNPSIENNVITKAASARSCRITLGPGANNAIVVSGCTSKGRSQGISTVITDIMYYNKALVSGLFNRYGIRINGHITAGAAHNKPTLLALHESKPLRDLITDMLKKSDNIIAGSLFKKVGEVYTKQPGSWENGSSAVTHILAQQMGVDTGRINVTDGSGLSRYNQVTPSQMMRVLDFAFHHRGTNYEFISALPVAGVDGTLKHRLRNVAWKVRAKTGTMSGVVALAGYAINRNKEPLAFVIIINGHMGLGWKYKGEEDQIVTALTRYAR